MAKNRPTHVSRPVYPGGLEAMKKFVAKHLNYPEAARKAGVEGTVVVRYTLDYTGKVVDAKVKKHLGHSCDKEALRVVRMLRFVVPQSNKKKVRIHQDISIHFKLPKVKKQPPVPPAPPATTAPAHSPRTQSVPVPGTPPQVRYTTTKSTEKTNEKSGYSYSIRW